MENINTYDKVATDIFGVDKQFGFRFNYNFRWFWSKASTFHNFKVIKGWIPLSERKILTAIHLN